MNSLNICVTTVALATALFAAPAFSAGSDSTEPPKPTNTTTVCEDGMVWDEELQKCVLAEDASLTDDQIYDAAREMAYAGLYDEAIHVLELAANQNDPRILNYLGFANRKAGRLELGMDYYLRALEIQPDYILARSYMGQGLVQQGEFEAAEIQLAMIEQLGGKESWAYRALELALEGSETSY